MLSASAASMSPRRSGAITGAVLTLRNNSFPNPIGLVGLIQKNHAFWKIRPDQKIVVTGDWPKPEERLKVAERITSDLARVAAA